MKNNTLSEWLNYIENNSVHINHPHLDHLKLIAKRLNIWPISQKVITVTGTNGKGSCVTLLNNILRNAGYKIGKFTSPHLLNYHERITCDNQPVTDKAICDAFSLIEQNRENTILNYFEWAALAAFIIFKQQHLDAWILEAGVGGRLDPVNIIDCDLAIITTIAIDHVNWLGNTREQIGFEKSGIMRSQKPVICGDFITPSSVKAYAHEISAPLFCQNNQFGFTLNKHSWSWWSEKSLIKHLPIPLIEIQNAATVLAAVEQLAPYFQSNTSAIHQALRDTYLPGRFQKIKGNVTQLFDVAHNPAAAELLAYKLLKEKYTGRLIAVFAMLKDKDHHGTIAPLLPIINEWYLASLNIAHGCQASQLAELVTNAGGKIVFMFDDVISAYNAAINAAGAGDYVVILGSFYTVAEVLKSGKL